MMRPACTLVLLIAFHSIPARAAEDAGAPKRPSVETLQRLIVDKAPQTRIGRPTASASPRVASISSMTRA